MLKKSRKGTFLTKQWNTIPSTVGEACIRRNLPMFQDWAIFLNLGDFLEFGDFREFGDFL